MPNCRADPADLQTLRRIVEDGLCALRAWQDRPVHQCRVCWTQKLFATNEPRPWPRWDLCRECAAITEAVASWYADARRPSLTRLIPEVHGVLVGAGVPITKHMDRPRPSEQARGG